MEDIICYKIVAIDDGGVWLKYQSNEIYINFEECAKNYANENSLKQCRCVATRDITKCIFTFYTVPKIKVVFKSFFRKTAVKKFHELNKAIIKAGYSSCDNS